MTQSSERHVATKKGACRKQARRKADTARLDTVTKLQAIKFCFEAMLQAFSRALGKARGLPLMLLSAVAASCLLTVLLLGAGHLNGHVRVRLVCGREN